MCLFLLFCIDLHLEGRVLVPFYFVYLFSIALYCFAALPPAVMDESTVCGCTHFFSLNGIRDDGIRGDKIAI